MLVAQKDAITKIMGIITPEFINTLEKKLGGAFTIVKILLTDRAMASLLA